MHRKFLVLAVLLLWATAIPALVLGLSVGYTIVRFVMGTAVIITAITAMVIMSCPSLIANVSDSIYENGISAVAGAACPSPELSGAAVTTARTRSAAISSAATRHGGKELPVLRHYL